jgi:protein-S-isoprenylcysteine O-methyltransferase Ste14
VGSAAIWVLVELHQSIAHRSAGVKAKWGSEIAFRVMVGGGVVAAALLARLAPPDTIGPADVVAWVGLVLFWCGLSLRVWSIRTLGRYFTFIIQTASGQPVIVSGPYRVIRHPSYAGLLLIVMAVGLFIGMWWSLISLTVAVAAGLVFRIRVEERALMQNLGEDYRGYAATHKRLVPFIW